MTAPLEACPHRLDLAHRVRWWLARDAWADAARTATRGVRDSASIAPERLLKSGLRRLVFTGDTGAWVAKAFPLTTLKSRLKHRKYAPSEARNLWLAAQRSVPVPALYGVGWQRRGALVRWNAVLMERLEGDTFDAALRKAADPAERSRVLERAALLFRRLYLAGCNHIDLKPEALRLGADSTGDAIIDFQYCTFRRAPHLDTIMAQAGHFVHWWEKQESPPPEWVEEWIGILMERLDVPAPRIGTARRIFEDNRGRVPSIAERLRQ